MTCIANLKGVDGWVVVAGTSKGDLICFAEREVVSGTKDAHVGAVLCLAEVVLDDGDVFSLVSGGKDKKIRVWNNSLQEIRYIYVCIYIYTYILLLYHLEECI
jgi:WD40 repeat protein